MKAIKTGNNQYLKELNKAIIMDLIRTSEGISRKALADKTGLSATATGTIVSSLLDDEYIQEKGLGKSSGEENQSYWSLSLVHILLSDLTLTHTVFTPLLWI